MEANANPSGQAGVLWSNLLMPKSNEQRGGWCDQIASSQKSNEQRNSTQTAAAAQETKANVWEQYYSNPTSKELTHAPIGFDSTDKALPNLYVSAEVGNNSSGKTCWDIVMLLYQALPLSL